MRHSVIGKMKITNMHIVFHEQHPSSNTHLHLRENGRCIGSLVLPGRGKLLLSLVIPGKTVDTGLDQNKAELGVFVLSIGLEMLANSDCLLDQEPKVLGDRRSETVGLQDTEDLVTSNEADLGDPMGVAQGDTDLGWGQALASELSNVLDDILRSGLKPRRRRATVGKSRGRNALAGSVHATHFETVSTQYQPELLCSAAPSAFHASSTSSS